MADEIIRCYADTSVYGGVADREFAGPSRRFFDAARAGALRLVTSPLVEDELRQAPKPVRDFFVVMREHSEIVTVTAEVKALQFAYMQAGIVAPRWSQDALHVATATVAMCRIIVSWNFKHIVNFRRIPLYNAVNAAHGHGSIAIYSPLEVTGDED